MNWTEIYPTPSTGDQTFCILIESNNIKSSSIWMCTHHTKFSNLSNKSTSDAFFNGNMVLYSKNLSGSFCLFTSSLNFRVKILLVFFSVKKLFIIHFSCSKFLRDKFRNNSHQRRYHLPILASSSSNLSVIKWCSSWMAPKTLSRNLSGDDFLSMYQKVIFGLYYCPFSSGT